MPEVECGGKVVSDDRGFVLISVLLLSLTVAGLLMALQLTTHEASYNSQSSHEASSAKFALEAALARMTRAFELLDDPLRVKLVADGRPVVWDVSGRRIAMRAQAESGKWDLNSGDRDQIAKLIRRLVPAGEGANKIVTRLNELRAANQRVTSVRVILAPYQRLIEAADHLEQFFTVATDQTGIDPATTQPELLASLVDAPRSSAGGELEQRLEGGAFNRFFVGERPVYSFEVELLDGRILGAMKALVSFPEHQPPQVHEWKRISARGSVRGSAPP
jgi:hypothetical protein